ncbi:CDP-glucose 4,6-dehydratase [Mucilaginibacter sp.]
MLNELKDIYQGKKVFLTGHTGFKGSWMLKILTLFGAEVKGYALAPNTKDDLFYSIKGDEICDSVIADLRDYETLNNALFDFQPDYVFHLAAQPLVRLSYHIPAETFAVNAIGTAYLLDAIRKLKKPCVSVFITTDKVYHNNEWLYPYRETDRLGGYDPYSASKACAELVIDSYKNSFFNLTKYNEHKQAIAIGRAGNVIGGGDWSKDRLIPDIARSLGKGEKIIIRNPSSVRPWQHVLEPLAGYLLLGTKLTANPNKFTQAYNFGPHAEDALTVKHMVELAIDAWTEGSYDVIQIDNQPHEAGLLKLDISKAINELGWKPKFNASKAVKFTIEWYKKFYDDNKSISNFTEAQIISFFNA